MAVSWFKPTTLLDKIFEISILIKGVEGIFELIGGLGLLIGGSGIITWLTTALTQDELSEEPHDRLANYLLHTGQHLASGGTTYLVAYLLVHAAIKLVAVIALLQNKLWAYPFSLATLGVFMLYQIYQVTTSHSWIVAALTVYDVFLLWLIWREFQTQKRRHQTAGSEAR
jgi:uncharacterized membrane protein